MSWTFRRSRCNYRANDPAPSEIGLLMCAKPAAPKEPESIFLPIEELDLDLMNPRLAGREDTKDQESLIRILWTEGALDELALSMTQNGYFQEEPLFCVIENGRHVVVEGNRRLATVKLLHDEKLRKAVQATDLPSLTKKQFITLGLDELPVIVYPDRESLWPYVGFRHVNGPMTWDSWSKAQYIAQVKNNFGIELSAIEESIGDKNHTVPRLYRGLMVLNQACEQAGYDLEDRKKAHFSFSHLYTGLPYAGFERHLGLGPNEGYKPNPVKKAYLPNLRELMIWLFGSRKENRAPVIQSQNPDLKRLDSVLKDKKALDALRSGLGLKVSHEISLGDNVRFREAVARIKYDLQQAKGLVLHGFNGEKELIQTAGEISELANSLLEEMRSRPRGSK